MKTYTYILTDWNGNRIATIKATSSFEALCINFECKPRELTSHQVNSVIVINKDYLNDFKNNINKLK